MDLPPFPPHMQPRRPPWEQGGCYTCRYFGPGLYETRKLVHDNRLKDCLLSADGRGTSVPHMGCAYWEREPGSDDEIHDRR